MNYGLPWSLPFTEVNCPQPPRRTNLAPNRLPSGDPENTHKGKRVRRNRTSRRCNTPTNGSHTTSKFQVLGVQLVARVNKHPLMPLSASQAASRCVMLMAIARLRLFAGDKGRRRHRQGAD